MGLVGLGMAVTPHAEAYRDLANRVTVAAAFAPSEARRRAFAERFGFPVVDTLEAILDDPTIAAVGLQTPPNTHLDLVCRCAAAGKHVLLEKPLEIDTERAAATVAACEAAGVTLGVMLQHRFRPSGLELRRLLDAGALGAVTGGQVRLVYQNEAGGPQFRLGAQQGFQAGGYRTAHAGGPGAVVDDERFRAFEFGFQFFGPCAQHDGHGAEGRFQCDAQGAAQQAFAPVAQQLLGLPHPGGRAGGEQDEGGFGCIRNLHQYNFFIRTVGPGHSAWWQPMQLLTMFL